MIVLKSGGVYVFKCKYCDCEFRQTAEECVATGIGTEQLGRAYCPTCGNDVLGKFVKPMASKHVFPIIEFTKKEEE